jgi:cytochrome c biogenesis protein CcmG, thiol:disulfide interchange protein DsbE
MTNEPTLAPEPGSSDSSGASGSSSRSGSSGSSWRGPRIIAVLIGVITLGLVGVLATRETATERDADSPLVGQVAPEVTGNDVLTGKRVQLSSTLGRWTLVNFFGTWCPGCIREHPELVEFEQANRSEVSLLSLIQEDSPEKVKRFFEQNGGSWPVLDVPRAGVDFGVIKLPETYLITPDGRVAVWFKGAVSQTRLQTAFDQAKAGYEAETGSAASGGGGS